MKCFTDVVLPLSPHFLLLSLAVRFVFLWQAAADAYKGQQIKWASIVKEVPALLGERAKEKFVSFPFARGANVCTCVGIFSPFVVVVAV